MIPLARSRPSSSSFSLFAARLGLLAAFLFLAPSLARGAGVDHRLQIAPTGAAAFDLVGYSVAGAGDVNGDGFDDLIVGAGSDTLGSDPGRAYVFFGGPSADATPDLTLTGEAGGDQFGTSVAGAGDVNADGFDDLIVGAYLNDGSGTSAGRAYVYFGGPAVDATPDLIVTGGAGYQLGWSVAGAGDVNADGFDDLIVGANTSSAGGVSNAGRAHVYFGGTAVDTTPDMTLVGAAAFDWFGYSVAGAGDVNGDGFDDVIVGALLNDANGPSSGRAYVYFGGPAPDATADLVFTGGAGSLFGNSVAGAGDVNGDGFDDLIVGAYSSDVAGSDRGLANVYFGGLFPDTTADWGFLGKAPGDRFGISVAGAGDVNGDGFDDVIVGAYFNAPAGRAYVYFGGPAPDGVDDLVLTGEAAGDVFGVSVAGAGDVNSDGFDDLIVGAYGNDAGGSAAGRAYVYDCFRYLLQAPNGGETWNVGASQVVRWLGAEPADLWLSVDGGGSYVMLEHAVGGDATNALPIRVPHMPTKFARVKLTPADAAVTGRDHSDSLFTIRTSVALLSFVVEPGAEGGAALAWNTEPGVGPAGLAGYRLYRLGAGEAGNGARIGPNLISETRFLDREGAPGHTYRLVAVNGLLDELELGRQSLALARTLAAWPLPYRGGALTISFATASAPGGGPGAAEVALYDVSGRLVRTIARGSFAAGHRTVSYDGMDERGLPLRGGVYLLRASSGGEIRQLKLVVLP